MFTIRGLDIFATVQEKRRAGQPRSRVLRYGKINSNRFTLNHRVWRPRQGLEPATCRLEVACLLCRLTNRDWSRQVHVEPKVDHAPLDSGDEPMQPSFYFSDIVLPTVQEFLEARNDRRRAYIACIVAFHICDYIARAEKLKLSSLHEVLRFACEPSFDVIEGICNGSKHAGPDTRTRSRGKRSRPYFYFSPWSERDVPVFAFDVPGAGFDRGRWDVPGLEVEHSGQRLFVDWCLQAFILSVSKLYPRHFHGADFNWIDGAFVCHTRGQG